MQIIHDNAKIELPDGSTGKDLADSLNLRDPREALAIAINGNTYDLSHPLSDGDEVHIWNFDELDGKEVFWHTSAHVLAQAILRLYPNALPTIGPPIEKGFYYDFANLHLSEEDLPKIEKEIKKIISENHKIELHRFKDKDEALAEFGTNPFKKELIEGLPPESEITAYRQGEFFDLCRGPHLPNLGKIKAFKLLKTSGSYWRGSADNEALTRIYGISFPSREELKNFLYILEESKKRDHRIIGSKLNLFSFKEEAPGMPFIHPNGMRIWESLTTFWRTLHYQTNYQIIQTPQLMTRELWEQSGHWKHYRENMFSTSIDYHEDQKTTPDKEERLFAIKPMNCPGCMLYYKSHSHSYREFPLRIAEFGHVHRREPSGALNGMFRVQSFHQDDAHIFMRPDQIKKEILHVLELSDLIYKTFGLTYTLELSTRPKKSIGTNEEWEIATKGLQDALDTWDHPYKINEGDGAFYGPKIDLHIHDALGRAWQCGTIQLDMALPERFSLEYKDADGKLKRPVMIHRAIFGSMERFFGILVEHFAGKFPLWLSPHPIRIIPVAEAHTAYAEKVSGEMKKAGFWCDLDDSSESVGKKIRTSQLQQINYMLTVGDKEVENQTIALRTRDNVVHGEMKLSDFLTQVTKEYRDRSLLSPFEKKS